MRLFTRFLILSALIAGVAAGTVAAAGWTIITILREITGAYSGIVRTVEQIDRTKLGFELLFLEIAQNNRDLTRPEERHRIRLELDAVDAGRDELAALPDLLAIIGPTTASNLVTRAEITSNALRHWVDVTEGDGPDSEAGRAAFAEASAAFESFHMLSERVEQRMLSDAGITAVHAEDLRDQLQTLLVICLGVVLLSGVLAALLFRRWMLRPIVQLRGATAELARGNFAYRLNIPGRDELAQLSREVNSMAATVMVTQQRLVEQERLAAVGEMMRRLVHNLRNPLAGIRSLAEITRYELPASSDLREHQDRIVVAVDRFEAWLNDLLRSTSPMQLHLQPIAPAPLLERAVESVAPTARGKEIALQIEPVHDLETIEADPLHLEQAVVSLLSNAVEMTPPGGRVVVAVAPAPVPVPTSGRDDQIAATLVGGPGGWCLLSVDDSGPGVAPDLREKVFAPYFTTRRNGSGIGLAMVHNIARSHGGRAWVEDSALGGARFVIALPMPWVQPENTGVLPDSGVMQPSA